MMSARQKSAVIFLSKQRFCRRGAGDASSSLKPKPLVKHFSSIESTGTGVYGKVFNGIARVSASYPNTSISQAILHENI